MLPQWVDEFYKPCGPCFFCGGPDKRHRVVDSILGYLDSGESIDRTADDFGVAPEFVSLLAIRGIER